MTIGHRDREEIRIAKVDQQAGDALEGQLVDEAGRSISCAADIHIMFVLDAEGCGPGLLTGNDADRVQSIFEAADRNDIANLTLIEEFSSTTNLKSYFDFLVQHVDSKNILSTFNVMDEGRISLKVGARLCVNMIASYRGKLDIVDAVKRIAGDFQRQPEKRISDKRDAVRLEAELGAGLQAGTLREPDLIVFFGGRRRVGEVGVWMGAYSEFAFLDQPWHSFSANDLTDLLADFRLRERRFGAV